MSEPLNGLGLVAAITKILEKSAEDLNEEPAPNSTNEDRISAAEEVAWSIFKLAEKNYAGLFIAPVARSDSAYVEIGKYNGSRYQFEGSYPIKVGPDGCAYVVLGAVDELPDPSEDDD